MKREDALALVEEVLEEERLRSDDRCAVVPVEGSPPRCATHDDTMADWTDGAWRCPFETPPSGLYQRAAPALARELRDALDREQAMQEALGEVEHIYARGDDWVSPRQVRKLAARKLGRLRKERGG